jgi:hypothetical protein
MLLKFAGACSSSSAKGESRECHALAIVGRYERASTPKAHACFNSINIYRVSTRFLASTEARL